MKSTNAAILAALASTAMAQPHGHGHAHAHQERMEHQHHPDKRMLATEYVVEWVTQTVTELIDATHTEWITPSASAAIPTTFSTIIATTATVASALGEFFEGASVAEAATPTTTTIPAVVPLPVEPTTTSTPVEPAPTPEPVVYSAAAVVPAVVATPEVAPVVEPTPEVAPVVEPTTTSEAAPASTAVTVSISGGTSFEGKITWIGDTTGAYGACGQPYENGKMYVAVDPTVLDCGADGMGTPMTITANGVTVNAIAQDKCMGCNPNHIDVATDVYQALGYDPTDPTDGGMHNNPGLKWVLSSTK